MSATFPRRVAGAAVALATVVGCALAVAPPASANPAGTGVVINEVYGGGGNSGATYKNDFIELYNPTSAAIDITGWHLAYYSAGTGATGGNTALSGTIAGHSHYLIAEAAGKGGSEPLPTPDLTDTIGLSGTTGVVVLWSAAQTTIPATIQAGDLAGAKNIVDAVGWGGTTTSTRAYETAPAPGTTNATSIARTAVGVDTDNNAADFTAEAPTPQACGTACAAPPPTDGGVKTIAEIQGTTDTSPYAGQTVTTTGVVTADYRTGGFNGFYLQTGGSGGDPADDQTPGASDAIFVYGSISARQVAIGDSVQVSGTVSEHQGMTEIDSPTVTRLDTALPAVKPGVIAWSQLQTDAQKEAHEGELIEPQGDFTVSDNYDANWYGSFTLAAGDTPLRQPTDAGPAGSAAAQAVADDNARRMITLDDGSSLNYSAAANANTPLPWLTPTNPVSIGARVTFVSPMILDYRNNLWNFQPTSQITDDGSDVATFGDRRAQNQQPAAVGGDIRLATFNVENYFPTTGEDYVAAGLGTCTYYTDRAGNRIGVKTCTGADGSPGPRGAATDVSFARQQSKIVTGINRLGASIVSLEEIENSVKFGQDRDSALSGLVDALNAAAGAGTWAYVPSPAADALPPLDQQDVIRTAFIYRPADVSPVGVSHVLTGDSGDGQSFSIAREPLAQAFKKVGARDSDAFLVVANHLKSKGADATGLFDDCAGGGDAENTSSPAVDQGAFNCTRVHQVQDMMAFASQTAAAAGTNRIFLLGDFNAYTHEDPMQALYAAGYTDLGSSFDPSESTYSYNGLEGSLDHVLANAAALAMVTGADVWQINAQEAVAFAYSRYNYNATLLFNGSDPFAASDHDPVVVGLTLPSPANWNAGTVYHTGDQVYYQGSTWQALWWTQNQKPGDPNGPWQQILTAPDGTAMWTPSRVFNAGDVVEYHGATWKALWYSRNQKPGDANGPWQEIETAADGTAIWTPTRVFNAGDVVLYQPNGKKYVAQWYTRNQAPGQPNGPWKLLG